jgi:methyl-accepting chemotaxis protein
LVHSIAEQANRLMDLSKNLAGTTASVNQATIQINSAMGQVSRGTISQNEQVSHTHEALGALLRHIDEVSQEAGKGSIAADDAARAARSGTEAVGNMLSSMQMIRESVINTAKTVEALGGHSEKIDIIIKLIGGIAYQIKLLGINAAIEAAHAGQYGAGFLVVAGEIRSLAERTAQATREITDLVGTVKSRIHEVENVMGAALDRVGHGAGLAEQAGKVLSQVRQAVEANHDRLAAITAAMSKVQTFSHQVGGVMESVAAVSEENAAAVEEVTASTREMSAQLEEVTALAQALASMADAEQQLLAKFNLSGGA